MADKPSYEELEQRIRELEKEKSDLLRMEARLRESESSFIQLFESAPVPMAYASESDGYSGSTWNAEWYKTFGYSRETADGRSGYDIGLWADPADRHILIEMANRQNYVANFETLLRREDGAIRNCSLFGRFIEKTRNRLLMIIYFDITERKAAEKELHRLRNSLSNIINSMPSILVGVDSQIRVTQWNKKAEQDTGISQNRAYGKDLSAVLPRIVSQIGLIKKSIQHKKIEQRLKTPYPTENKKCFEDITIYPIEGDEDNGAVIRLDDVTEKVQMETMVMQSEKMLSLGGLAAGMAHEINNPLGGMIQTASVLSNRLGGKLDTPANVNAAKESGTTIAAIQRFMEKRDVLSMLKAITDSGIRIADLVKNMLDFVRKSDDSSSSYDPVELVEKTLALIATDYDFKKQYDFKNIEIIKAYDSDLPMISCHGARIQQVLLNVLRNGAQAMQDVKEAKDGFKPRFHIRLKQDRPNWLAIEIADNGPGIDEETQKRIFEPFFTTKPVGVGTGLGLSISYFIITEYHGGQMRVESIPGHGATFIIHLPVNRSR